MHDAMYLTPMSARTLSTAVTPPGRDEVDSPSLDWGEMAVRWQLPHDLLGGTLQMRRQGTLWLPREPREEWDKYLIRLSRAVLYNGYRSAVKRVAGKPFSKPATYNGELPEQLRPMELDIDLQGTTLTQFAKSLMWDAVNYGKTHFLVEFPRTGGAQTFRDERTGAVRPYFVHLKALEVIGWRSEIDPTTGEEYPVQVRVRDEVEVDDGEFATIRVERVRVYEPGLYRTYWRRPGSQAFVEKERVEPRVRGKVPTRLPIVTAYFQREGFFVASPPLEDLAWLNLAHWQSSADQRNALRFGRLGILFGKGFAPEEIDKGIVISPNMSQFSTNEKADLKYVEVAGTALSAGERDLEKLEKLMEVMGVQPFVERSADGTATGKAIDAGENNSLVQTWVRALEDALDEGFLWAHEWVGAEVDEQFSVDIFNEFNLSLRGANDIDRLLLMRNPVQPQISHKTFIREARRRGILSEEVESDTEREQIILEQGEFLPTDDVDE